MNQVIKNCTNLILTFTWFEDNKVFVKYFVNQQEVKNWEELSQIDKSWFNSKVDGFFLQNESFNLIKWSY